MPWRERRQRWTRQGLRMWIQRANISVTVYFLKRRCRGALGFGSVQRRWPPLSGQPRVLGRPADQAGLWARQALPSPQHPSHGCSEDRGPRMRGDALSRVQIKPAKRQVLQTIAGTFLETPSSSSVASPACSPCNQASESQVRIQ